MTSILKADTIQDAAGNNIINENANTITIGASGDTTNIIGTLQNNGAAVGGVNSPIVYAQGNAGTSCANSTSTKIELENEIIDTASLMASSRFTVTSDYQGKYLVSFQMSFNHTTADKFVIGVIKKNGSGVTYGQYYSQYSGAHTCMSTTTCIVDLTTSDYLEFWGEQNSGGTLVSNGGDATHCSITKLIT